MARTFFRPYKPTRWGSAVVEVPRDSLPALLPRPARVLMVVFRIPLFHLEHPEPVRRLGMKGENSAVDEMLWCEFKGHAKKERNISDVNTHLREQYYTTPAGLCTHRPYYTALHMHIGLG